MTPRMNIFQIAPEGTKAMIGVETAIAKSGVEHSLLQLVKIRASQINGCAFCIDMHVKDAIKNGESHQRIHLLDGWRDSPSPIASAPRSIGPKWSPVSAKPMHRMPITRCSRHSSTRSRSPG